MNIDSDILLVFFVVIVICLLVKQKNIEGLEAGAEAPQLAPGKLPPPTKRWNYVTKHDTTCSSMQDDVYIYDAWEYFWDPNYSGGATWRIPFATKGFGSDATLGAEFSACMDHHCGFENNTIETNECYDAAAEAAKYTYNFEKGKVSCPNVSKNVVLYDKHTGTKLGSFGWDLTRPQEMAACYHYGCQFSGGARNTCLTPPTDANKDPTQTS